MFLNTGSGGIYIFEVKLKFEMLIVHGQQHSFLTHERVFFWKNALTIGGIRARHLLSYVLKNCLWRYVYFWSNVKMWNVNCTRATWFFFGTPTGVLVKVSKFLRQKMFRTDSFDSFYNQTALAFFLMANFLNCGPSWWVWKRISGGGMETFSVPAGNRLICVLSEKSATYFASFYSLDWFVLVHNVLMGYLCVDNHEIVTLQCRNINPRRPHRS